MLNFKAIKQWLTKKNSTPDKVTKHFEKALAEPEVVGRIIRRGTKKRQGKGAFGKCRNSPGPQLPSGDPRFNHALRRITKGTHG